MQQFLLLQLLGVWLDLIIGATKEDIFSRSNAFQSHGGTIQAGFLSNLQLGMA